MKKLIMALLLVAAPAWASGPGPECFDCVDKVDWVNKCEHTWYVHDILEPALGKIRAQCTAACESSKQCPDCSCNCPRTVSCDNAPNCLDFASDLAVGLYGMAWDCQGRGMQIQFRQSDNGWVAKCRKRVRVQFPTKLEDIRDKLKERGDLP